MGILVTADRDINWFRSSRKQNAGGEIYIYIYIKFSKYLKYILKSIYLPI